MPRRINDQAWWVGKIGWCDRCGLEFEITELDAMKPKINDNSSRWRDCPDCGRNATITVSLDSPSIYDDEQRVWYRDCSVHVVLFMVAVGFFLLGATVAVSFNW